MVPERVILVDPKPAMTDAWREAFRGCSGVEVVTGRFEDLPEFDCLVSAANSFGLMDGGVDLAISKFFGWDLQTRVQQEICDRYFGEQPVGTSFIVETGHAKHPWLAHTPTMRVPMSVRGTDHAYIAMWAMLSAVATFNQPKVRIRTVACPGLATGWGEVPPGSAARQMAIAWWNMAEPQRGIHWPAAQTRHDAIVRAIHSS